MMTIIEGELSSIFGRAVLRKANKTQKFRNQISSLKRKAEKIAAGAPEVMVKITGFSKGAKSVYGNLTYVSRNGSVELETDSGRVLLGAEEVKEYFQDWKAELGVQKGFKDRRDSMHIVLSMPPGTEENAVKDAVRDFAKEQFDGKHEYVFALHTDEKHPHCHLIVKYRDFDGNRPSHGPEDIQKWREIFADKMEEYGVMANATPRISRGVTKKSEKQAILHMQKGSATRSPRVPRVIALAEREAAAAVLVAAVALSDKTSGLNEFDALAIARQQDVRSAWRSMEDKLSAPKPFLTINGKELNNDSPDYERIARSGNSGRFRNTTLYKPYPAEAGFQCAPRTIAGMRNVSSLPMVRNKGSVKVLVSRDALHRMGWRSSSNNDLRRSGVGPEAVTGGMNLSDAKFARSIGKFVAKMPEVETRRQELRNRMQSEFVNRASEVDARAANVPAPSIKTVVQPVKSRDIER